MKTIGSNDVLIGKVVGYQSSWMLSKNAGMRVCTDEGSMVVKFDARLMKFIQSEYPRGSAVPIEFYSGEWHVSDRQAIQDMSGYDTDVSALEMLNKIGKNLAE